MENFVSITDEGVNVLLVLADGSDKRVAKIGAAVKAVDIFVILSTNIGGSYQKNMGSIAAAEAEAIVIDAMLESGGIPAGGATAANQVSGNASLAALQSALTGGEVLTSSDVSDDGSVAAGARSVSMETSFDYTGVIDGITAVSSRLYTFEASAGKTLPAISYTTTTGSIIIRKLV